MFFFKKTVLSSGGSLSNLLFENGCVSPLPEILSLVYCFQVLQGLTYLHDTMEVVHRDIKRKNHHFLPSLFIGVDRCSCLLLSFHVVFDCTL